MSWCRIIAATLLTAGCLSSVPVVCFPSAAYALSITNHDDHDHKVTIVEGGVNKDQVLKPEATIEGVCDKGCVIRLNDSEDDEYELEGNEVVSIEDGYLYYDGPGETGGSPADEKAPASKP